VYVPLHHKHFLFYIGLCSDYLGFKIALTPHASPWNLLAIPCQEFSIIRQRCSVDDAEQLPNGALRGEKLLRQNVLMNAHESPHGTSEPIVRHQHLSWKEKHISAWQELINRPCFSFLGCLADGASELGNSHHQIPYKRARKVMAATLPPSVYCRTRTF
jgi:hypothetical protein